jgi:putative methyltransferase (TIGR04325 family)
MKNLLKSIIPPFLLYFFKYIRKKIKIFSYVKPQYEPLIYHSYSEFNDNFTNLWESPNWINHVEKSLHNSFIDAPNVHKLSVINACLIANKVSNYSKIHLVDFGGGCGVIVPPLLEVIKSEKLNIDVSIIDSKSNITLGKRVFLNEENIHFFDQEDVNLIELLNRYNQKDAATILNISSTIQYIPNYKDFLNSILKKANPMFVCITRFPQCEDVSKDAFTIQNVTTPLGYCGSTIVNLFGKKSIVNVMGELNYSVLFNQVEFAGKAQYFEKCDNEEYRNMTMRAFTFVRM